VWVRGTKHVTASDDRSWRRPNFCVQSTVCQWLRLTFFNCCWPLTSPLKRKHLTTVHRLHS